MRPSLSLRSRLLILPCLLAFLALPARAADKDRVGYKVDDFTLEDTAGKSHKLKDYRDRKAVVVVFLGTQCPINNAFLPRLAELHKTYADKGVQFLAVNSNRNDTPQRVAEHAKENKVPFPVLKDRGNVVADNFRAERTPEAFVLVGGKVVYRGRIDDQFGYRHRRDEPTTHELADALDDVLAGKAVRVAVTEVEGCLISRAVQTKKDGTITFTKEIAPILQKNCQECHRPGQIGPMPLISYEDAVDWSGTIREVVQQGRMPPWHADPKHGKFANDRRLSSSDREALISWIDGGMPHGESALPKAAAFAEGWRIGKPDVVFEMPMEYTVPAKSQRRSLRYMYSIATTNFKEDMWVQAAEARPGNRKVVHHIIVYVRGPGQPRERLDGIGEGFLVPYAPGDMPAIFPEGTAKKVPRGAVLIFQMHYTPTTTEEKDRSSVGLIFAKKPPQYEARTRSIAARGLSIPAGAANHKVTSTTTFRRDAELVSLLPHMHLRGKTFEYRAVFPDGKEEVLLRVPRYDFNWQTIYRLEKPLPLPAGTRIDCTAWFDNSPANKNNPDPKKNVRWGEQTWDEMMIGFVDYVYPRAK
jgi:peroxiredoxin/mono/diheme cytochrome c family protein